MAEAVEPLHLPDGQAMRAHVEHLFGGWLPGAHDGLVELAWTDTFPGPDGRVAPRHAQLFSIDQFDELVALAAQLNAVPGCNVYVGAALRRPDTPPLARTRDRHAYALTALYTDLDDEGSVAAAVRAYGTAKPTLVVITGHIPFTRAQLWWRLDEPLMGEDWSPRLAAIAARCDGDASVQNAGRVMRLAGSIAWPVKPGRVTERTGIQPLRVPGLPAYMAEHLALVFPFTVAESVAATTTPVAPIGSLGIAERLTDGRERHMLKTVMACLGEFVALRGRAPTAQELFDIAWPQYERGVDLVSRPGRGADEMAEKCRATVRRFLEGKIQGARTVDETRTTWRQKHAAREALN
jgi:hypothetical protein